MRASKTPLAGGFIIAVTTTVGALFGARQGQPSAGMLIGLSAGIVLAVIVWLFDRR